MKKYISLYDFQNWFSNSGSYKNNFSYEGQKALFEYLEQYEEEIDEVIDFDPISLCCEFSEYDDLKDYNDQHDTTFKNIEELNDEALIIKIENGGFIAQNC